LFIKPGYRFSHVGNPVFLNEVVWLTQKMKHKLSQLLFIIFILIPCTSFAATIAGKVVSVADGDTITVLTPQNKQIKVRLAAIDTPEKGQAFGQKAKEFTSSMVAGKNVSIEPETIDRYGRTVGMVSVNGSVLNEQIVKHGLDGLIESTVKGPSAMIGYSWRNRPEMQG